MKAQEQIEKLKTLQESFDNLANTYDKLATTSAIGIETELAQGKEALVDAIEYKGGESSADKSLQGIAEDIKEISNFPTTGFEYISEIYRPRTLMEAYNNRIYLKSITDNFIEEIKSFTFMNCSNLVSVNFLNVVEIGDAFSGCKNLKEANIPNLVSITGNTAFMFCSQLESLNFSNLVNITGTDVFANCSSLKLVNFPNLVSYRSRYTFNNCPLENLVLGVLSSVADFYDTKKSLRNITIGQDTDINLPFANWTATNVISEGQSGIDELNANLYNNLLTKLADHSEDGQTRKLQIGWLAHVTQENIDYANSKGWTLTT